MFSRFASVSRRAIPRLVSSAKQVTPNVRLSALATAQRLLSSVSQAQQRGGKQSSSSSSGFFRTGLLAGAGLAALGLYTVVQAAEQQQQRVNYAQVREDIAAVLDVEDYDDGSYGPLFIRLAWHASGTYDKKSATGGSNGATMRFAPESADGANAGLALARKLLEPIKAKHPGISYADLWTLAGVVAVEQLGGPTIPWRPGRSDKADGSACPPVGRLPDASKKADHVRDVFYRMGFNDQEIVALAGAHALGRCHRDRSGYEGPWTNAPTTFSNEYYRLLLEEKWTPRKWDGPLQLQDSSGQLMMTPADMAFVEDPSFKKYVVQYAKDQNLFFKDFAAAYSKLLELGVKF